MIKYNELRLGNLVNKNGHPTAINVGDFLHVDLATKELKGIEPIPLTIEWLERMGFIKNIEQPLLPISEDYSLTLPVNGGNNNEIWACIINDKDPYKDQEDMKSYARASVNDYHASNNMYFVHQLQNLFFALTGEELNVESPS